MIFYLSFLSFKMAANTNVSTLDCKVGFVGGGKMAQAMAKGFISANVLKAANLMASARTDETIAKWTVS